MTKTRWHIQEGFYIVYETNEEMFSLVDPDESAVFFSVDDIDDLIDALHRAKEFINADSRKSREQEALIRWGNQPTPVE